MRYTLFVLLALVLVSACGGTATSTNTNPTAVPTLQNAATAIATEISVVSTRVDRRAPTLAPTEPPTEPPTAAPVNTETVAPTATAEATQTATTVATQAPAATATPKLAPAVYVTALAIDPPAPKSKPAQFVFHVGFLNTVGENVNYPRWRVLILPKGQTKGVGDPQGTSKTIAPGESKQDTEVWSIKVQSVCESYSAVPVWEDENGKQTPFPQTNGNAMTLEFRVCP